ncbi:uncharacterized protein LOC117328348 [Pecten maximus]|uniref:uncharacterized protein LOC117328348 n=1 Tax=Pecten maximus TaxID=6579 RepID=UPI0014581330|nr:uncharacterized protein LOC117328348 [Pecten maximus]
MEKSGYKWICEDCGKTFTRKRNLNRHRHTRHSSEQHFKQCQIDGCQRAYRRTEYLRLHLARTHKLSVEEASKLAKEAQFVPQHIDSSTNNIESLYDLLEEFEPQPSPQPMPNEPIYEDIKTITSPVVTSSDEEMENDIESIGTPSTEADQGDYEERREVIAEETFTIRLIKRTNREGDVIKTEREQIFSASRNGRYIPSYDVDWASLFTYISEEIQEHYEYQYTRNAEDVEEM